jgi:predicted lipoprotein with Yx(FWY)xxD motif
MKRTITFLTATAAALALIAAGCGGSAGGSPYSSAPYGSPTPASASNRGAGAAKIGLARSQFGRILVDSKGRTLYLFEKDKSRRSACYGQCATSWPPLLTHGKPATRPGAKQSLLGTTRRPDGGEQVTYAGHPLYRFVEDRKPGQTKGEGVEEFGAGWDLLSPAGERIESDG